MKILLAMIWGSIVVLISLQINIYKTKKTVLLSLCSLVFLIALGLNIKIYEKESIYVPSILLTLLVYLLMLSKTKIDKKYKYLFVFLYIIYVLYLAQLVFVNIYNYQLFVANLSYFLFIGCLLRYFIKIKDFDYNEKYIFNLVSIFSLCNSILGILQFLFNKTFLIFAPLEDINFKSVISIKRVVGFVGANNGAGNLGAILYPVLLFKFFKERDLLSFIVLILDVVFTILTFTRIGYLAILVESTIFFIFGLSSKKLPTKILKYFLIVIVTILFVYIYNNFFDRVHYYLIIGRGNTQEDRFIQFKFAINQFLNHPILGIGSGQYTDFYINNYGFYDISVHSQYLNILLEQGVIAFVSFATFNIYIFKILIDKFNKNKWFICSLFMGNLIVINFNPNQYYAINIYVYYFVVFGLMFSDYSGKSTLNVNDPFGDYPKYYGV